MTEPSPPPIQIEVTIAVDLQPDEAFPDGAPEHYTAADVLAEIKKSGTAERALKDWDLLTFGADFAVSVGHDTVRETLK